RNATSASAPSPRLRSHPLRLPSAVGGEDDGSGRNELVDAIESLVRQSGVDSGEEILELLHRARADDRGGHRGMLQDERQRQMLERHLLLLREVDQLLDDLELPLVLRKGPVVA